MNRPRFFPTLLIVLLTIPFGCTDSGSQGTAEDPSLSAGKGRYTPNPTPTPPEEFVLVETTNGDMVFRIVPKWSPFGARRFLDLVRSGFYDDTRVLLTDPESVMISGVSGDPENALKYQEQFIPVDELVEPNRQGTVVFRFDMDRGPSTRTTEWIINLNDNTEDFDHLGYTPFGEVIAGLTVAKTMPNPYGDQPSRQRFNLMRNGNDQFDRMLPGLPVIKRMTVLEGSREELLARAAKIEQVANERFADGADPKSREPVVAPRP